MKKYDMVSILGEEFFKEEERHNYLISAAQKQVWAMQLELYLIIRDICNKYGLRFWVMYGSLLGAIRHKGFIPWDDDIDVAMPRNDFNIFLRVAPTELSDPYFLQSPYTSPSCFMTNATIRNSNGTFTPKIFRKLDYNKGIPVDIFPFDYCDPETWPEDKERILYHIRRCSSWMKMQHPELLTPEQLELCQRYHTDEPLLDWESIQQIASAPTANGTEYSMMKVVLDKAHLARRILYKTIWFEKTIPHPFESIDVEIPIGWHGILSARYGDNYMEFPPVQERGFINNELIVDPFTPYRQYDFDSVDI